MKYFGSQYKLCLLYELNFNYQTSCNFSEEFKIMFCSFHHKLYYSFFSLETVPNHLHFILHAVILQEKQQKKVMRFLIFILPYFYFLKINHYSYTCLASLPTSSHWDVHIQKGTLGPDSSLLCIKYIDSSTVSLGKSPIFEKQKRHSLWSLADPKQVIFRAVIIRQ